MRRKQPPFWSKLWPCHPQLQPPRAKLTSSDASQLSHWCSPNPFPNERLARPSLSRQIGWLCWVVWTNGEGVELQTEWKWPRETEGDTERETEMEGGIALAYAAPTHLTSPCCCIFVCATMILRWITMWPTSEHPVLEKIKQISLLDSSHPLVPNYSHLMAYFQGVSCFTVKDMWLCASSHQMIGLSFCECVYANVCVFGWSQYFSVRFEAAVKIKHEISFTPKCQSIVRWQLLLILKIWQMSMTFSFPFPHRGQNHERKYYLW